MPPIRDSVMSLGVNENHLVWTKVISNRATPTMLNAMLRYSRKV
ncbi:hypothetical protein F383_10667 [Gossypium arboreum]|uniref:Uncharacterized protein n=1 Tax=Gossypium arboreum TaxID=29729 RepID=A0A0B0PKY4_GOSAR|nr:hypothetical protein F383_10667 [Gossypium arboreum]